MTIKNPMLATDHYKIFHREMYPENTTLVYSNFTPRTSRNPDITKMGFFGLQYICKDFFIDQFNNNFFYRNRDEVAREYQDVVESMVGRKVNVDHVAALHNLGYLPIHIKALPEGTFVPMGCPTMTIKNTHKDFFWLTNYFETPISSMIWQPCTSLTTAKKFYDVCHKYANQTSDNLDFVDYQCVDFSFRGMPGVDAASASGAAHLVYFKGTDTVSAIPFVEKFYNGNSKKSTIGCSVMATEHAVSCVGLEAGEMAFFKRMINEVCPNGIVSLVADTYDLFQAVTEYMPKLKPDIMNRWERNPSANKVVLRPDSGVPHKIINGDPDATTEAERKGVVRLLYDIFGGKVNSKGYLDLHPCIGTIYGDGINFKEQVNMLEGLKQNGFSSTNITLGLGSFSYQYVTRDTFGTVCKATYCEVNGEGRAIFKNPKTGAWKKSHKGLLRVNADLTYDQEVSWAEEKQGILEDVFIDGKLVREHTFEEVRANARKCP